ncbi:MAG TPA: L,D-transpeptidase family protein [Dehalococcoidia bacterium]
MRFPAVERIFLVLVVAMLIALVVSACGGDSRADRFRAGVTVEPLASPTGAMPLDASPTPQVLLGGKPAAPDASPTAPVPTSTSDGAPAATVVPEATSTAENVAPPEPTASVARPTSGRWIDVDVTSFAVRLMDGDAVVREIAPVAVGAQVDTGAYLSTQTGLFHVFNKVEALAYDAPFNTYISHWVGFDPDKDNGFHSFLKDAGGTVVDPSSGRVSNGCIRTGEPEAVFSYAEIGMPVWVHS